MRLIEINKLNSTLINQLVEIWNRSVRETHLFLPDDEIKNIEKYIPQALNFVDHLAITIDHKNNPVAFMGIEGIKLEMLFVLPEYRGKETFTIWH